MENQAITRSIPGSVGLLGTLLVAALAVIGVLGFVDGSLIGSGDYLTQMIGVIVVTALFLGGLIALGARSRRWLEGPYW